MIPKSLQDRTVELAHEGHQGVVKTKKLLREKGWFPYSDKMVEHKVENCLPCQAATHSSSREPQAPTANNTRRGAPQWQVKTVLQRRLSKQVDEDYDVLVEWKNTWEPMSHLTPASQNDALKLPLPEPKHKGGKRAKQ